MTDRGQGGGAGVLTAIFVVVFPRAVAPLVNPKMVARRARARARRDHKRKLESPE